MKKILFIFALLLVAAGVQAQPTHPDISSLSVKATIDPSAVKGPIKPFERTGTDLERMHFCAKNPGTFLVCLIEGSLRVQVNLTRIGVLYRADFKFCHRSTKSTASGRKFEGFAQDLKV